jgi:hypothetical protein
MPTEKVPGVGSRNKASQARTCCNRAERAAIFADDGASTRRAALARQRLGSPGAGGDGLPSRASNHRMARKRANVAEEEDASTALR